MSYRTPISRYAFINAKLQARIGKLLPQQVIDSLIRSKSVEQLLHHLEHTVYAPLDEIYQEFGDVQALEAFIFQRNITIHREVASALDPDYRKCIIAMNRKAEVENLKSMIRLYFSNTIKGQNIDYRLAYLYQKQIVDEIDWLQIANASNFDQVKEALSRSIYHEAVSGFDDDKLRENGLFTLEITLDKVRVKELRNQLQRLSRGDRKILRSILDRDADLKNIINIFRYSSSYHLPNETLETLLFEGGTIYHSKELRDFLLLEEAKRSPFVLLEDTYPAAARRLKEMEIKDLPGQLVELENYLFASRKEEFSSLLRRDPFSIGIILSYFFLEERQDNLVKTIINGVHYQLSTSRIRELAL
ncbi:MAG: V-type ATPase subunit [Sphaerochaetaceae bacterium]|nr:V-type ATPase subunit [Sphaerochaetaceae bacterium]